MNNRIGRPADVPPEAPTKAPQDAQKVDAILPAGGRISGAFAAEVGTAVKALIEVGEGPDRRTVLERTLNTLRATGRVERAVVIGPGEVAAHPAARGADMVLPEGESGPDNVYSGLDWLRRESGDRPTRRALIVTTDLPFLTVAAITSFLDACPPQADVSLPVIGREDYEAHFPGTTGDYVRLGDGQWTLGGAFLVDPRAIAQNRGHIDRVFNARKSQLAMARLLGPLFIARLVCRRLTLAHIQQRCEQLLGCSGAAVLGCAPELAFDIDLPEEYHHAVRHLAREGR